MIKILKIGGPVSLNSLMIVNTKLTWNEGGEPAAQESNFYPGDTPFSWEGDRVLATAGNVDSESTLFDPAPTWACSDELRNATGSEFHKGVMLRLSGVPV